MKRIIAILMTAMMMLAVASCSTAENTGSSDTNATESTTEKPQVNIASPVELLNKVWESYAEADKFAAAGGDMTEANMNMEGPGVYGLEDAEGFAATTQFPAASISKIDSAATLVHMMNANTFTGAAYHVVNADDMETLATEVKDSVMSAQWMCGFPEKLVIVTVGDYMVSYYGNGEIVDTFTTDLKTAYPEATVVVEEAIVA